MEDREIVDLFFQRSEEAIVQLTTKYGSLMHRVAYGLLRNQEEAKECINDACLGVWNAIPPAKPDPLSAFVCRITKNIAIGRLRYQNAEKRNAALEQSLEELEEIEGKLPTAKSAEEAWTDSQVTKAIERFLDGLDQKNRVMFVKRYWFAWSTEEIAKDLSMRENSVAVRLLRLRKKLRDALEKEGIWL
ncbi:MAG: RNA polymerase sigma factor [Acetatifactor sp.]|nr:RNA polymerase sigma factor [Acetatifactor sp.]